MKILYEANDGTTFETEEACRDYEKTREIPMMDEDGCLTDDEDHARYIQIKTEEQESIVDTEYGFALEHVHDTFKPGWYVWIDENDYPIFTAIIGSGWYHVDELNDMMNELIDNVWAESRFFNAHTMGLSGN